MDKLVTINCKAIGQDISDPKSDVTFSLQVSPDGTSWSDVTKYVTQRAPLDEAALTSEILQEKFYSSSQAGSNVKLDVLVSTNARMYRVNVSSSTELIKSVEGSISGSF